MSQKKEVKKRKEWKVWEEFAVVHREAPLIFQWGGYEPLVKYHSSSTAVVTSEGMVIIDPLLLCDAAFSEMVATARVAPRAILLTSENHQRGSLELSQKWNIPIYAPRAAEAELEATDWFEAGASLFGVEVIDLPGFALGEVAFFYHDPRKEKEKKGVTLLVVGDAIIHGEEGEGAVAGLFLLPKKYCHDAREAMRSIQQLKRLSPNYCCFAHGYPLVPGLLAKDSAAEKFSFFLSSL